MHKIVNGKRVELTPEEEATLLREWQLQDIKQRKNNYRGQRRTAYEAQFPDIVDQLDFIYHNGLDNWKKEIKIIKDKYPKPLL